MFQTLTEREKKILIILNDFNQGYIKCERIAHLLSKSIKTVSNDIRSINNLTHQKIFVIDSKRNNGYRLIVKDQAEFEQLMKMIKSEIDNIFLDDNTKNYDLLCYLLNHKESVKLQDLIDETYLSESTIRNEIRRLTPLLNNYGLNISTKNNIELRGREHEMRLLIMRILRNKGCKSEIESAYIKKIINNVEELNEICTRSEYVLIKYNDFSLATKAIKQIARYLAVANMRNRANFYLDVSFSESINSYHVERSVAKEIVEYTQATYNYFLTETDVEFVTLMIAISCSPRKVLEKNMPNETIRLADYIINYVCELTENSTFKEDRCFCEQIYTYVYGKKLRDQYHVYNECLPFVQIKRKRSAAMELGIMISSMIEERFNIHYTEREVITLLTYLGNIFSKTGIYNQKRNIAVASKYGMGESRRIVDMLKINFYQFIDNITPMEIYEINELTLSKIDMIITDDRRLVSSCPVYLIHKFALGNEIPAEVHNTIRNRINNAEQLLELVGHDIYANVEIDDRKIAFKIINQIYQGLYHTEKNIIKELMKRDHRISYEYGNRSSVIFFPDERIKEVKFVVLISKKPFVWQEEMVNVIFVVFAGNSSVFNTRYIGGALPSLLENIEFINDFTANPTHETLKKYLHLI